MATNTLSQEVSKRSGWSIFMGVLTAAVGLVMIIYPLATAAASTVFVGSALIVAGVAQSIFAFASGTAGKFFLNILLGILYGIAGISLVASPGIGLVTLTAVLGVMLIAEAVSETFMAFALPAGARPRRVPGQRAVQPAARRDDSRAMAGQLGLGDRHDGRRRRPRQRGHARGHLRPDPS